MGLGTCRNQEGADAVDFRTLDYLTAGNPRQRRAYQVLTETGLALRLSAYGATLVGTVPLGLDIPTSDLDVICEAYDLNRFERDVRRAAHHADDVSAYHSRIGLIPSAIITFTWRGCPIEVFGQRIPVPGQHGYRHLLIEQRVLTLGEEEIREHILALRRAGSKTEPAFAECLGLAGDPYESLLQVENWSDAAVIASLHASAKR